MTPQYLHVYLLNASSPCITLALWLCLCMHQCLQVGRALGLGPHLHQDDIELVEEDLLSPEGALVRGQLDDEVADVVFDALPLLLRQGAPPELDDVLQDLRRRDAELEAWSLWPARSAELLMHRCLSLHAVLCLCCSTLPRRVGRSMCRVKLGTQSRACRAKNLAC